MPFMARSILLLPNNLFNMCILFFYDYVETAVSQSFNIFNQADIALKPFLLQQLNKTKGG